MNQTGSQFIFSDIETLIFDRDDYLTENTIKIIIKSDNNNLDKIKPVNVYVQV